MVIEALNKVTQGKDVFGTYTICTGHEGSGTCFWCGGPFPDKRRRRFCSEGCRQEYERHFFWPVAAAWCLEQANHKCQKCGVLQNASYERKGLPWRYHIRLEAAHIKPLDGSPRVYNVLNRPENLMALCPSCHRKYDAGFKSKAKKPFVHTETFPDRGTAPLPGWEWFYEHYRDPYPEPSIEVSIDGKAVSLTNCRKGDIKALMRA